MGADEPGERGVGTTIEWSDTPVVLLEITGLDCRERAVCRDLLPTTDESVGYCRFSFRRSVADQLTEVQQHGEELPPQEQFVQVRGGMEGVFDPRDHVADDTSIAVDVVENPSNMTKLGITLTEMIDGESDENKIAICFDSLTALLQYVSLEEAVQFISLTNSIVRESGGSIHYHVDPSAHETETMRALRSVVDTDLCLTETGVEEVPDSPQE